MSLPDDDIYGGGVPRDRWGRPLIVPPGGTKATAYMRCTTYVGVLEDTFNLSRWQQRMVALGLAQRPDLVLAAAAHHDDKEKLNEVCQSAMDAAAAGAAAGVGTALHKLTERLDLGQEVGVVPEAYRADIAAYAEAMKVFKPVAVEQFVVHDELKVGGTPDLVLEYEGKRYIADKKTGSIEWGAGKIAMQLAMYSRSVFYDHQTNTREPIEGVNRERGIVIHLPAGEGRCELRWVDLTAGWNAIGLATAVREWRGRKGLIYSFDPIAVIKESFPEAEVIATTGDADRAERVAAATHAGLLNDIKAATTNEELTALYHRFRSVWTDAHTAAAKKRKTNLHQALLRKQASRGTAVSA